jgi:hypothetical protein
MSRTFLRVNRELLVLGWALLLLAAVLPFNGLARAHHDGLDSRARIGNRNVSVSWNDYWKQVEDTRQVITEAEKIPLDQAHVRLEEIIPQWEAITSIELPDGSQIAVDHSFLVALLSKDSPDLERIDHLLAALLAERDNLVLGQFTAEDRASLNRILARPEFQWEKQNDRQPNALEKLWERIQQELGNLSRRLFGFTGANYVIGIGAVLLLTVMLLYLFRNLLLGFVAETQLAPRSRSGSEVLTADTALQRAQDLSRDGDYRSAVRYLYLSALLLLEERGLLTYDRTKTNREYLHSVSEHPELETPLRHVVDVFDRVWYGYQPLEDQDYQFYEQQVEKLRQQRQLLQQKSSRNEQLV